LDGTVNSVQMTVFGDAPSVDDVYHYTDEIVSLFALDPARKTLADTDGGLDWINMAAISHDLTLNLNTGIPSNDGLVIEVGTVIENAITGDGNDVLTGNSASNKLYGARGNDTLNGSLGDDLLNGGTGDDTFVFNFEVETQTQSFRKGNSPSGHANQSAWDRYELQLDGWYGALIAQYGVDLDTSDTLIVTGSGKNFGSTFRFDNTFSFATSVHGDGHDILTDFGQGNDHLQFNGMSEAEFVQLHASGLLTVTANTDTVISWGDGAVTLVGQSLTFDALLNDGHIIFG
jgi:Ca2+-binding RTX toxin-like protein